MSRVWLVARHEYQHRASQKGFIFMLVSLPLILALMFGIGAMVVAIERNDAPLGYVDHAGLLSNAVPAPLPASSLNDPDASDPVPLVPFETEEAARQALQAGEIQAYYVIAADYPASNRVELVYLKPPADHAMRQFHDFVQINRLTGLSPEVARRAVGGSSVTVYWPDDMPGGGREFSGRTFISNLLPFAVGFGFIMLLSMNSGHLIGIVGEEKENRTIEVLMTSVSPRQLIAGKVLGVMGLVFTEFVAWAALIALLVWVGGRAMGWGLLENIYIESRLLWPIVIVGIPSFVMMAALMAAIGATVVEVHDAQQATALFILPAVFPFWLAWLILEHPDSPLAVGLTLFPVTAPQTLAMRLSFSQVPAWQIATSAVLAALCAAGALWLAGLVFRQGMLHYGQRLSLRQILRARG